MAYPQTTPQSFTPFFKRVSQGEDRHADIYACIEPPPGQNFVKVCEPACGAGGMELAIAQALIESGKNPARAMWAQFQDLDRPAHHLVAWERRLARTSCINQLSAEPEEVTADYLASPAPAEPVQMRWII